MDLAAVADDTRVGKEPSDVVLVEAGDGDGDGVGIESVEHGTECGPLAKDRDPREPGLERL